jgi:hypothetical protein
MGPIAPNPVLQEVDCMLAPGHHSSDKPLPKPARSPEELSDAFDEANLDFRPIHSRIVVGSSFGPSLLASHHGRGKVG